MTKKEMFNLIATVNADNTEIVDFCKNEIALLEKRAAYKSDKPTKTRIENEGIKTKIVEILVNAEEPMQAKAIGEVLGVSPQKVSALLKQMKDAGTVVKTVGKKNTSLFSLA